MDRITAQKQYEKALQKHQSGKIREAEKIYRKLVKAFPDLDSVWTNLGVTLYQQGKAEAALKALDRAIKVNPTNLDAYTNRAATLMALKRPDEAAEAYQMVCNADPKNAGSFYNYGNVLYEVGRVDEAEAAFQKAISLNNGLAQAHYNLGYLYMREGRAAEAESSFRKAIGVHPGYTMAYVNLGNLLDERGQPGEALENYRLALEIEPGYALARRAMARTLLGLGKPQEALEEAEKVLENAGEDADAWVLKGNALNDLGEKAAARIAYRNALDLDPENEAALRNIDKAMGGVVPAWHFTMLADDARNAAYRRAIERAVKPGMRVLDIGAGSGLLSMMAVRAGAEKVDACELVPEMADTAREVVAANGMGDSITVHAQHSATLELEEKADLLVSEILDGGLIGEGVLPSHRHAISNLLKPDAQVIPARAQVFAQLVALPWRRKVFPVGEVEGFDLSAMRRFQRMEQYHAVFLDTEEWQAMSEVGELWEVDFANPGTAAGPDNPEVLEVELVGKGNGHVHGVAFWFDLWLDAEEKVTSAPGGELKHWGQVVYYFEEDKEVQEGQKVRVRAMRTDTTWEFEWLG